MSDWIKSSDRLPERQGKYLVLSEEGDVSVEKYAGNKNGIYCESSDSGYAEYWMELPPMPKC